MNTEQLGVHNPELLRHCLIRRILATAVTGRESVVILKRRLSGIEQFDLAVTVSVIGPRRKFDEIETWHYWDLGIEDEHLFLASGGHFYDPRTGGDASRL
jgi:hypothetical protein